MIKGANDKRLLNVEGWLKKIENEKDAVYHVYVVNGRYGVYCR